MKKSDLKTGMVVECRSGLRALVMKDNCYNEDAIVFASNNWTPLNGFSEDLIWHNENGTQSEFAKTVDIMAVYTPQLPCYFLLFKELTSDWGDFPCIWKRNENIEQSVTHTELK